MANPKPLASLSSGLLARPGQAKPAMRPQVFNYAPTEDLGWNDMGHGTQGVAPAERAKLADAVTPAPKPATAPKPEPAAHKAAFTLRLDADRHLRLRLASAVAGRSSQQLVVAALDAFLNTQPQVETLARQVPANATQLFSGEK